MTNFNNSLKIVNIKGKKFLCPGGYTEITKGYAFANDQGYVAFDFEGTYTPYSPCKKALQEILSAGGFTSQEDLKYIQEIHTK